MSKLGAGTHMFSATYVNTCRLALGPVPGCVDGNMLDCVFDIIATETRSDAIYFSVYSMLRRDLVLNRVRRHLADRNMTLVTGMEVVARRRAGARPGVAQK